MFLLQPHEVKGINQSRWNAKKNLRTNAHELKRDIKHDAVGDGRLRPLRCRHLANWTKHMRRLWFWPVHSIMWKHDVIHKTGSR